MGGEGHSLRKVLSSSFTTKASQERRQWSALVKIACWLLAQVERGEIFDRCWRLGVHKGASSIKHLAA